MNVFIGQKHENEGRKEKQTNIHEKETNQINNNLSIEDI